ncbi:hypothetical protein F7725_004655 [Dissostichus mawsoni]|uniref:Poly [ADP-ribose] polymerase n=1 Tax=Dissostichus mawsoni TaxID=36200 RepID=A0A7J5XJS4_DISMA|nr:hypothetical protein F7725_004655 [Dissostichus mawsoni]
MTKLTDLYQAQCYSQTFRKEELKDLTQDDVKDLKQLVETEGLYVELSQGTFKVSGLNNGVNKVMQMINASLHGNLRREVRVREEEDLYPGNWERLPKTANHSLENNDVGGRIVDAQGTNFTLPLYWDNMAAGEALKTVELLPSYAEYRTVKEAFKRTVGKTVLKIERLQNVHLRRAYEAQKKQISDKYKQQGGECEKLLYHGTTQDNCESIVKTGFNRRFSGQNAADGSQLMFVARVLTGIYTQGQQNMRVPPPVSNQGGDRYDSVVDRVDNPQIIAGKMDEFKHPLFFEAKDLTDKEKDKTTTKVNTKGPEKIFKLDIFLMYFLRDNLKAYKLLQKRLSCIGSQVEFDFEEEEAVVRGDIEKGPGGAFGAAEQWELQVDRVLINFTENYLCYHVVEPKKAKILLQDLSFVTDDIKVYREGGYPVVVGETEAVREKIAILEKSLPTRKELPMVEKLFKLVEEEFSREMHAKYPEVKINIGSAMVTLEGPDKEVQSGANTLEDLKQKVKEKRVKLSTALMTFLGSSGAVSKYQTRFQQRLRNPVSLEVGSEVVMSSLSSDALDEAEATLQRDFDVANVELQEALAAPPDLDGLKEILFKAKNEANSREFRVDVSFIPGTSGTPNTKVRLVGYRENANVMVVPMLNKNLTSTKIGKHLFQKAGNAIKSKFDSVAANCTVAPGDVLQVDAPPSLGCSKLFFIECLPWDGVRGQSVKALGNGLKRCLDLCVQQGYSTVAFPVIGPGVVLKYPMKEAIQLLMENICQLGLSASSGSLTTIQIVIKPGYPDSEECYQDVYRHPGLNVNQGGQAIFRSVTSDLDEITMTVGGGVKLQLVFGDITDETTDAVVNTTDFVDFQIGVCKDILTVAGADVEAELKAAKYTRGDVFVSQSGEFPCEALFHVCGQKDAVVIEQLVIRIVEHCESFGFKSVAIPAISAGAGGLDPCVVARAVLRGVKDATSSFGLNSLTDIRLVLLKSNVFLAFKEEAMQMFSTAVINKVASCTTTTTSFIVEADLSIVCNSSTSQQSVFRFLGLSRKDVDGAMTKLTDLYQAQCYSQTFRKEELKDLTQDDVKDLKQLVETEGLYVELSQGTFKVSGLNNGVNR